MLTTIKAKKLIAAQYGSGNISRLHGLPRNPNGSLEDIAAITDESGRILGMMPHPERAIAFTQHPTWTVRRDLFKRAGAKVPTDGPGLPIFKNGVNYFK